MEAEVEEIVIAVKNVPAIRFPGFQGEWMPKQLDSIVDKKISYGIVQAGEHVENGMPYIKSQDLNSSLELKKLQRTSEEIANKYRRSEVSPGDIVFSLRGSIGITQIVPNTIHVANLTQGTARISVSQKHSNLFVRFSLQNANTLNRIKAVSKGSTFQEISLEQLRKVFIITPSLIEQQKVASFLSAVDDKIQQLTKKKYLLINYKKGLMQQIISQKIRFKDENGQEFSEWEEKKVGEVFRVTRGNVLSMSKVKAIKDDSCIYPVYSSQTKNKGLSGFYDKFLFENSITWTTDGANAGDVNFRSGKFYCTNVCGVLVSDEGYANLLIAEILNSVSRKYVSYVGNPKLMNNVMAEISIEIPSSIKEQERISDFLNSIDNKITLVTKQLEQANQFKKGLLQQMFV